MRENLDATRGLILRRKAVSMTLAEKLGARSRSRKNRGLPACWPILRIVIFEKSSPHKETHLPCFHPKELDASLIL